MTINSLVSVEVHRDPIITAVLEAVWVRSAVALPGQCLETPQEQRLLSLAEILVPVQHCPSGENLSDIGLDSVRQNHRWQEVLSTDTSLLE